ncbi:MAG: hypothetical protein ABH983_02055 [Candidatus Micrarchaeota archaeon]
MYKTIILFLISVALIGCVQQPTADQPVVDNDTVVVPNVTDDVEEDVLVPPNETNDAMDEPLVGGDSDEHGCIGSAGYSWCEEKQKCLRSWEEPCSSKLNASEAREIAMQSDCVSEGNLSDSSEYNNATNTWWIDLEIEKPGCSPACVVSEEKESAEINWRCTGLQIG